MKSYFVLALAATLIMVAGCATPRTAPAPGPISSDAVAAAKTRWPDATSESLEEGRGLFLKSCNRCHGYPDRSAYSEEKWPGIMEVMGKRAKLTPEQIQLVLHFIIATRTSA
jgi:cytochrome c5